MKINGVFLCARLYGVSVVRNCADEIVVIGTQTQGKLVRHRDKTMNKFTLFLSTLVFTLSSLVFAGDGVSPLKIEGATTVSAMQAKALFDGGAFFVDVRKDKDWDAGRIPDAIHLNIKTIFNEMNLLKELKKEDKVVMYCNGEKCMRSSNARS